MVTASNTLFHGIYAATVAPMQPNSMLDETALREHINSVATVPGMRGLLINGHAGENFVLTAEEKQTVIEIARATVASECLLVAGVNAESSLDAAREAVDAASAGADAIMIFPPNSWALNPHEGTVIKHHEITIDATPLPVFLYQAPVAAGKLAYPPELLKQLITMPNVIAIKEGSWEVAAYEANRRLVQTIAPQVAVMASGDEHLLTSFILGSEGSLVSLAIIIPELIIGLDRAVRQGDLAAAQRAHEIIYPLAKAIYGDPPGSFANARLKTCLKLLGRLSCDVTRPPIGPLPEAEVANLRSALTTAGLLRHG